MTKVRVFSNDQVEIRWTQAGHDGRPPEPRHTTLHLDSRQDGELRWTGGGAPVPPWPQSNGPRPLLDANVEFRDSAGQWHRAVLHRDQSGWQRFDHDLQQVRWHLEVNGQRLGSTATVDVGQDDAGANPGGYSHLHERAPLRVHGHPAEHAVVVPLIREQAPLRVIHHPKDHDGPGDGSLKPTTGNPPGTVTYTVRELDPEAPERFGAGIADADLHRTGDRATYLDRDGKERVCEIVARQETLPDGTVLVKSYDDGRPSGSWDRWDGARLVEYHHEYTDHTDGTRTVEDLHGGHYHREEDIPGHASGVGTTSSVHTTFDREPGGDWSRTTVVTHADGSFDRVVERYDAHAHERTIQTSHTDQNDHEAVEPTRTVPEKPTGDTESPTSALPYGDGHQGTTESMTYFNGNSDSDHDGNPHDSDPHDSDRHDSQPAYAANSHYTDYNTYGAG